MQSVHIWEAAKDWLANRSLLTHHELHLIAGMLLYLGFGAVMRQPLSSLLPMWPVLILEGFNEWSDYRFFVEARWIWRWQDAAFDIALTIVLPLMVILRVKVDHKRIRSSSVL
jgi:hypothetical protein